MDVRSKLNMVLSVLSDADISWIYRFICQYFEISVGSTKI